MHVSPPQARVLIVGCGGIGGVLGSCMHGAGQDVSIATTNARVRQRWARTGPYLNGKLIRPALPTGRIFQQAAEATGRFDLVFVAVQPPQIEGVGEGLRDKLSAVGQVVCLSNGLCEPYLADKLGADRVLGAVVAWGARMRDPGHYERTSSGGFLLGALSGGADPQERMTTAVRVLRLMAPVAVTDNLEGARFSKLTINCAISTLGTIGGDTLGALLLRRKVRGLALAIMREAVEVARAEGVSLERVAHLNLEKLVGSSSDVWREQAARHALLLVVGARYRRLRSSMLAAMERGRAPAVDFLNGEISKRGRLLGIPTPFNDAAAAVIWQIHQGELSPGDAALNAFERLAHGKSVPGAKPSKQSADSLS